MSTIDHEAAALEQAGIEADERERQLVGLQDEAIGEWNLEQAEARLARLDATHPLTRDEHIVWARRVTYLRGQRDAEGGEPKLRRRLADLRARRAEFASDALIYDSARAAEQVRELSQAIEALEVQLGVQAAQPVQPDAIDEAVSAARRELADVDRRRPPLALKAVQGDAAAAADLVQLDDLARRLRGTIANAEVARGEQRRRAAEREQREQAERARELTARTDLLAADREHAFRALSAAAARLASVAKAALDAEAAFQAAAVEAGQRPVRLHHLAGQLPLSHLLHAGIPVDPADALPAAQRARQIEQWQPTPDMRPGAKCSVCSHPNRAELEAALANETQAAIAARFGVSRAAVQRHAAQHGSA